MRIYKVLLILTFSILFLFCGSNTEKELFDEAASLLNDKKYSEAVVKFDEIIKEYPESKTAVNALFETAKIYQGQVIKSLSSKESLQKSVEIYKSIFSKYPNSEKAESSLFMSGFILSNELHNYEAAKASYELFIAKYPDGELADDAEVELANLGKSPEEILKDKINQ